MARHLTSDQAAHYRDKGYVFPLPALEAGETRELRRRFDALRSSHGGTLPRAINTRPHLILKWLDDLIRDPRVLDPVETILGSDVLCWASGFFAKAPGDGSFVSWHQDATYWGLSSNEVVTAWIALSAQYARDRVHARRAGQPGAPARPSRHLRRGQSAVARPGDLG
jgi:chlorinating enzyme